MNNQSLRGDGHYESWNQRAVIADCLRAMDLNIMAQTAINPATSQEIINGFLDTIKSEAKIARRHDVLEMLHFAGLIYG